MAELIAQGVEPQQRWRRTLPPGQWLVLGRGAGTWAVPWDGEISRRHAELCWRNDQLEVRRLATARNPMFIRGQESLSIRLHPGEHFVIGSTRFTLVDEPEAVPAEAPQPLQERTYSPRELETIRYRHADSRLDVLSKLPDVISGASNEIDLFGRLVAMLLAGIPRADAVALVAYDPSRPEVDAIRVLHWDRRLAAQGGAFHPSARLIREAMRKQQSVSHISSTGAEAASAAYTVAEGLDWAFCTPVRAESAETWGIYVAGRFGHHATRSPSPPLSAHDDPTDLRDDLKFAELVAAILRALLQVRRLQRSQAVLGQFFAPVVLSTLAGANPEEVLAPRQTDVSVLFCDLRGFSLESEKYANNLMSLLERVSKALRVMTQHILDQGGVVGDFQGDAAMGFWGWPLPQPDMVARCCLAALAIRAQFEANAAQAGHPLADFQVGIGIATGPAVAGRIGTLDQAKVSVFGPNVNLASRLEGMTKILGAAILLDETTAQLARTQLSPEQARFRRVARVRPYGMDLAVTVTELLPPLEQNPQVTDDQLASYESAFEAFQAGRWADSRSLLDKVSAHDPVRLFLSGFIEHNRNTPPRDWNGVVPLTSKG